jgi:3'-5' exoribonuclease
MSNEITIPPIDKLPCVFRIVSIISKPDSSGKCTHYRVELFHEKASMTVSFSRSQPDIRLKEDVLVSVRWKLPVFCTEGAIQISRLVLLEHPIGTLNLFETVPYHWVKDRQLVNRAKAIMDALPDNLSLLIIAILWNGARFHRFCNRPASVSGHHSFESGNLLHTVEVAETIQLNASRYPLANLGISLAAALLHDIGKADEYSQWGDGWGMTDRGKLVGHRHTVLEWIAAAKATNRIYIPDAHYLSLIHALTAAPGAEFIGIRAPTTPEATLLNIADKLSGESSLTGMLVNKNGGWGIKHHHRKSKPFTLAASNTTNTAAF